nr:hypothetical protein [Cytobacillus oceanisediminis]
MLNQLLKGPLPLQEMSVQFNTSKTTLHHQLSILKAAKFIRVDKGIYSANLTQINAFSLNLVLLILMKKVKSSKMTALKSHIWNINTQNISIKTIRNKKH